MEDIRKQDPTFTNFVPKTAAEAVDRYVRCRRNGLKPMLVPECLIACAVGLAGAELDNFEDWIINPNEDLDNVELVPDDTIRLYNDAIFKENCMRLEANLETPPMPYEHVETDDEKLEAGSLLLSLRQSREAQLDLTALQEAVQGKLALSPAALCSTPLTSAASRSPRAGAS